MGSNTQARRVAAYAAVLFLLLGLAISATGQFRGVKDPPRTRTQSPEIAPTFRSDVRLVPLLATVKDENGQLIADLERDEFVLTDNGALQEIAVFEKRTEQPLSVSILIDVSLTTSIRLREERRSVERFLRALVSSGNEEDSAALYAFNDEVTLLKDFSRDLGSFNRALNRIRASGGTSLYDALYLAADVIEHRRGRHVVVVVSDGSDTTSRLNITKAIRKLHEADTVVYPIVVIPVEAHAGRSIGGENALYIIAQRTGGKVYAAALGAELDTVFSELLRDLRTQYLLGFYPRGAPPSKDGYHALRLTTTRPGLLVQTRSGYYGEAGSPEQ
ncbi:MAG: VWA domain-containing protein [Bryobacterales bacterium]|nr:VWA domain-containing protein [Bryobacterales bacterium]